MEDIASLHKQIEDAENKLAAAMRIRHVLCDFWNDSGFNNGSEPDYELLVRLAKIAELPIK